VAQLPGRSEPYPPDYARIWADIVYRNINNPAMGRIAVEDYRAAGVEMANGVIDRCKSDAAALAVEAAAAQTLWDTAPETAESSFLELVSGYRDTLNEHVNRSSDG
jgi:hypothetical protein